MLSLAGLVKTTVNRLIVPGFFERLLLLCASSSEGVGQRSHRQYLCGFVPVSLADVNITFRVDDLFDVAGRLLNEL